MRSVDSVVSVFEERPSARVRVARRFRRYFGDSKGPGTADQSGQKLVRKENARYHLRGISGSAARESIFQGLFKAGGPPFFVFT